MTFIIGGSSPSNVFQLMGTNENSATYALGWTLEQSPALRAAFIQRLGGTLEDSAQAIFCLQKHGEDGGYTDLEIHDGRAFHAIVEAKKGWQVPTVEQLTRYRPRLAINEARRQCLVSLSSAEATMITRLLPETIDGVDVIHLSWLDILRMANAALATTGSFQEKLWLRHLAEHMKEFTAMDRISSNNVYVVSLGSSPMVEGGTDTWIDVVERDGSYFHPVGNGFPSQPPTYIGFRYRGELQSVHHIESFEILANVSERNPSWISTDSDHFVYALGPAMKPATQVRTGNLFMNARCTCAIDTLLSGAFDTIRAARDETKRRIAVANGELPDPPAVDAGALQEPES